MTVLDPDVAPLPPAPAAPAPPSYVGLATRVLAFAADAVVINVVGWFVAVVIGLGLSLLDLPQSVRDVLLVIGSFIGLVWAYSYFVFFWSTTGQTPGNRLLGFRVIDARTGQPPRPGRAARRVLMLIVAAIPLCAGFLWILVDDRRRGWHDLLSRTVVVDVADEPEPIRSERPRSSARRAR